MPADKHVAINSAIRFASGRLSCGGRHGPPWSVCRHLSEGALLLRETIRADAYLSVRDKIHRWKQSVTFEHQEPVKVIEDKIDEGALKTVDDIILRLLLFPPVVITRREEQLIAPHYRKSGAPEDRYAGTGIVIQLNAGPSGNFFGELSPKRKTRSGKYDVPLRPFEETQ